MSPVSGFDNPELAPFSLVSALHVRVRLVQGRRHKCQKRRKEEIPLKVHLVLFLWCALRGLERAPIYTSYLYIAHSMEE